MVTCFDHELIFNSFTHPTVPAAQKTRILSAENTRSKSYEFDLNSIMNNLVDDDDDSRA